jgi:hypothetical protein
MANTFTDPSYHKTKPHASYEYPVGDADPLSRADVVNRTVKGVVANFKRLVNTLIDGATVDLSDLATTSAFPTGSPHWETRNDFELLPSLPNLTLARRGGSYINIDGVLRKCTTLPTLGVGGLSAATLYYIYAYWTGTDVALEASTTAPVVDATTGRYQKNGDTSRRVVGAAYTETGTAAWVNSIADRLVRSWDNESPSTIEIALTGNVALTDTTPVPGIEISTALRSRVVSLGYLDPIHMMGLVSFTGDAPRSCSFGVHAYHAPGSFENRFLQSNAIGTYAHALTVPFTKGLQPGYHLISLYGRTAAGTVTVLGGAVGDTTKLVVEFPGRPGDRHA